MRIAAKRMKILFMIINMIWIKNIYLWSVWSMIIDNKYVMEYWDEWKLIEFRFAIEIVHWRFYRFWILFRLPTVRFLFIYYLNSNISLLTISEYLAIIFRMTDFLSLGHHNAQIIYYSKYMLFSNITNIAYITIQTINHSKQTPLYIYLN